MVFTRRANGNPSLTWRNLIGYFGRKEWVRSKLRRSGVYRTILVPLDGSPLAEHALRFARTIAQASGARLLLLRVTTSADATDPAHHSGKAPADAEAYLARVASPLTAGPPIETLIVSGQPAERIVAEAQTHSVGLIAMSTHRRDGIASWVQRSLAGEVFRQVAVPVLLIPADCSANWSERWPSRILVPLDGSDLAQEAIVPATDLARALGAELLLLYVVEPTIHHSLVSYPVPDAVAVPDLDASDAERYLHRLAAGSRADGLIVSVKVIPGDDPARTILTVAREAPVDMIAMASHGRTGLERLLMGAVATRVVHRSTVPVLLVRPTAIHGATGPLPLEASSDSNSG